MPAISLTEALCWHVPHPICVHPSGQGPTSLSVHIAFPPSVLSSRFQRNLQCLFWGSIEDRWGEALLSVKMFLLNILVLHRHQSFYFPFLSPTHPSLEAESITPSRCLNMSWRWVEGWEDRREEKKNWPLSQNVSCCNIVVGRETTITW